MNTTARSPIQSPSTSSDRSAAPADTIAVSARDLRCSYGSYEAVRGIDLSIRNGEFFALLGTNGAGKTTTMEALEGHRAATSGTLTVLGGNPYRDKASIRPRHFSSVTRRCEARPSPRS